MKDFLKKIWEDVKLHPLGWIVADIGLLAILIILIVAIYYESVVGIIITIATIIGYGYFIYWQATKSKL